MSSLVVQYKAEKKVVKVSPNALIQSVLVECATHFGVNVNCCVLQHKRTILNTAQPFRFCNLSNNAVVELVVSSPHAGSSRAAMCKIALSVENGASLQASFDSIVTLSALLDTFISNGSLPANVWARGPELIYMRNSYDAKNIMETTTLASLGLAGQSARFKLRFKVAGDINSDGGSTESQAVGLAPGSASALPSGDELKVPSSTAHGGLVISTPAAPSAVADDHVPAVVAVATSATSLVEGGATKTEESLTLGVSEVPAFVGTSAVKEVMAVISTGSDITNESDAMITSPAPGEGKKFRQQQEQHKVVATAVVEGYTLEDVEAAIGFMLDNNFDAVSSAAMIVIAKYVCNIAASPLETKLQRIRTQNKVFQEKVAGAKGADRILQALGFRNGAADSLNTAAATGEGVVLVWQWSPVCPTAQHLPALVSLLDRHLVALGVPDAQRPRPAPAGVSASPNMQVSVSTPVGAGMMVTKPAAAAFDPYKMNIVRTAPQPPRGQSVTARQLEHLNKRRRELEGDKASLQRATTVLLPNALGAVDGMQEYLGEGKGGYQASCNNEADSGNDVGQDRQIKGALMKSIMKMGMSSTSGAGNEDGTGVNNAAGSDAPLTTRATRELERARRERVYASILIRVRYPTSVIHLEIHSPQPIIDTIVIAAAVVVVVVVRVVVGVDDDDDRGGGGGDSKAYALLTGVFLLAMMLALYLYPIYSCDRMTTSFPDRVCMQGFFHPRHCMRDVYEWVRHSLKVVGIWASQSTLPSSSLASSSANPLYMSTETTGQDQAQEQEHMEEEGERRQAGSLGDVMRVQVTTEEELYPFELYISPPRCVYGLDGTTSLELATAGNSSQVNHARQKKTQNSNVKADSYGHTRSEDREGAMEEGGGKELERTLIELGFAPATMLRVAWLEHSEIYKKMMNRDAQSSITSVKVEEAVAPAATVSEHDPAIRQPALGSYLSPWLLLRAIGGAASGHTDNREASMRTVFPSGALLMTPDTGPATADTGVAEKAGVKVGHAKSGSDSRTGAGAAGATAKPGSKPKWFKLG